MDTDIVGVYETPGAADLDQQKFQDESDKDCSLGYPYTFIVTEHGVKP
jgi:hypothetical protein